MRQGVRLAVLAALSLLPVAGRAAEGEFVFGLVVPLTGPSSENGKSYAQGAAAAAAMLNAQNGLNGRTVKVAVCDSQNQEQQAVICTKRLISQDHAQVLIGAGSTPQTIAISPTAEAAKVPLFKGLAGNPDQIPPAFKLVAARGWKRIAIIHDNSAYGRDIEKFMQRSAAEGHVEIVANEVYAPTDTDMTSQVLRIRDAKPDVVMNYALTVPNGAAIAKKLQQVGVTVPNIVGINLQNLAFVRLAGSALSQTIFVGPQVLLDTDSTGTSDAMRFAAAYEAMFKQKVPDSLTPGPADAMLVTKAVAAKGVDIGDPDKLRAGFETLSDVDGIQGRWTFTPTDHGPLLGAGITTMTYTDGAWRGL